MKRAAVLVALVLSLGGCDALLPALAKVGHGASWIGALVDVAEGGARAYFDRHPNRDRQAAVDSSVRTARGALAALQAALAAGEAAEAGELEEAKEGAVEAYDALRATLDELGVLSATPPPGGAETDAPNPEPLDLPTGAAVAARL